MPAEGVVLFDETDACYLHNVAVPIDLASYHTALRHMSLINWRLMTSQQQQIAKKKLLNILFVLRREAQGYDDAHRAVELKECVADLEFCLHLLRQIGMTLPFSHKPKAALQIASEGNDGRPVKYTGLLAYLDLESQAYDPSQTTAFLKEVQLYVRHVKYHGYKSAKVLKNLEERLTNINKKRRIWWVWGQRLWVVLAMMLKSDLSLQYHELHASMHTAGIVVECFTWALFILRAGVCITASIKEAWHQTKVSKAVGENTSFWFFFKTQLDRRKFILMNDLLNGIGNLIIFFYLNGPFRPELVAGSISVVSMFFLVDLFASVWRLAEESKKHQARLASLLKEQDEIKQQLQKVLSVNAINALYLTIQTKGCVPTTKTRYDEKTLTLLSRLQWLMEEQERAEIHWIGQRNKLILSCVFFTTLSVNYLVINSFFTPGIIGVFGLTMAGACIGFAANIIFNVLNDLLDCNVLNMSIAKREKQVKGLLEDFKTSKVQIEQQELYLQMKYLLAQNAQEQAMVAYQHKCLPCHLLIDLLVPAIFFLTMHFLALGPAIGVLALCVVLGAATKKLLASFAPQQSYDPHFFKHIPLDAQQTAYKKEYQSLLDKEPSQLAIEDVKAAASMQHYFRSNY